MDTIVERTTTTTRAPRPKTERAKLTTRTTRARSIPTGVPAAAISRCWPRCRRRWSSSGSQPHQVLTVSGIGCSSNLPGFINTYGMHTLHGRALAVATGVKLANHDLKVIVTGGDGDGYGIGGNHFVHTMRRNVDLTYIVMDNQIYGLTTGQALAHQRQGHEDQEHAVRQRREARSTRSRWPCRPGPPTWPAASAASRSTWSS